jgi:hypothetical protein
MTARTDDQVVHALKNHLAVIIGFCDLLVSEAAPGDPRTRDLLEVHQAAREAIAAIPEIARRLRLTTLDEEK